MSTPLVDAVIWQESRGNPNAVNPRTGASGLMQVMPDTARDPGFGVQPLDWSQRFDRNENKRFGTDYLGAMLSRYRGDVDAALAAYNWGPGNADRWVSQGKPMDALPAETRDYITKIKGRMQMAQADSGTMSDAGGYRKVTDPDLLRRLEGVSGAPAGYRKVEDPETIARLEGTATPKAAVPEGMVFDPERNMYIDTMAAAERAAEEGGTLQKVNEYGLQALLGIPALGEYVDEGLGALDETFGGKPGLVQERVRSTQAVTQERDPLGSMAAQIGGGLGAAAPAAVMAGPMIAAGAPASPLGAAAYGGLLGLLFGGIEGGISGYGEGNSGDRMEAAGDRAMSGGLLGGLLGAAAPFAARGVGNLANYVRGRPDAAAAARLGLSRESAQVLGEAMDADNYGGAVGRNLQRAGPDAMVADAGPSAGGLLDWAINRGGRGAVSARAAVEDAATQAGRGVDDALTATLGAPQGARATARGIADATRAGRTQAFDAAFDSAIDYSAGAGRNIEDVISRIPGRTLRSAIQDANEEMISLGLRNQQIMAEIADDGSVTFREMPNVRQLHELKRALDAQVVRDDFGRVLPEGIRPQRLARELREAIGDAAPAYRDALAAGADKIGQDNALRMGRNLLRSNVTREDVAEALANATDAERRAMMQGLRMQIDETLANTRRVMTDPNVDAREAMRAVKDLSSRAAEDKLTALLGPQRAQALLSSIDRQAVALERRAMVARNSATAPRQAIEQRVKDMSQAGPVGELLKGQPIEAARRVVQVLADTPPEQQARRAEEIYAEIANFLTQRRGQDAVAAVDELARLLDRSQQTEALAGRLRMLTAQAVPSVGYPVGTQSQTR